MNGLLGKKIGMTRVFDDQGRQIPVTVLEVGPCAVLQRKDQDRDGYDAVQCGFGVQKEHRVTKPRLGHFKKAGVAPPRYVREFRLREGDDLSPGDTLTVSLFEGVAFVDVQGTSKGRGFQGVVRRHGMHGGPKTHGGQSTRRPGAIGCCAYPSRVHKGKRMPGHMGHSRVTVQNLRVVKLMPDDNAMLVCGAVPGPAGGLVVVTRALKKPGDAS